MWTRLSSRLDGARRRVTRGLRAAAAGSDPGDVARSVWTKRALLLLLIVPVLVSPSDDDVAARELVAVASSQQRPAPATSPSDPSTTPAGAEGAAPVPTAPDATRSAGTVTPPPQPPVPARAPVPDQVEVKRPDLVVRPGDRVDSNGLFSVLGIEGVEHLVGAVEVDVRVEAPTGPATVRVLVVDPVAFRPLTPEATAQTRAVWERLRDGEMVVRHDIAQQLQLPLGGNVELRGPNDQPTGVRVGAFASNGTPPLAEAIVPWDVGTAMGVSEPNLLVIAVSDDQDPGAVSGAVTEALGGGDVTRIEPPEQQQATLVGEGANRIEPFTYIDHGDGMITIDRGWVERNITSAQVPILGTIRCHRLMLRQLQPAFAEVQQQGLAHLIDTGDYGGCFVPRHILFDPSRPLSMHAWGLAIDVNVQSNMYGARPTLDPRIVRIFERWGFEWGGRWGTPDGMHFELRTIIE